MKTAISIPDHIFWEVDRFARESKVSRSYVFYLAVEEYMKKVKAKKLLANLNAVYSEDETPEEKTFRDKALHHFVEDVLEKEDHDDQTG
jgi:metal-responsive CopG/Arc/MetJ family transcriptional regulator